jgi:polyphosphate kinase 2
MAESRKKYYGKSAKKSYSRKLEELQIELVKLQRHFIAHDLKILVIFEGRDAAGKDGTIKRIVEHLSPRETRVVALGKPSDRDRASWYFQRYVPLLPAAEEMVLMNRSWYNRAGVERVMGFCTEEELAGFMNSVGSFEQMLIDSGIRLLKYYLDISRAEQARRLEDRRADPLKQWKISPIDEVSLQHWDAYSAARNEMFGRTSTGAAPWFVVRADNKRRARLNVIRHLLAQIDYPERDDSIAVPQADVVFEFTPDKLDDGSIAK